MTRLRGKRRTGGPLMLTARDLDILRLVGMCSYVSTTQIAREFFPTPDRARRRLRQLYDAGYLQVTLAGSTSPNLLSLTQDGGALVRERSPDHAQNIRVHGTIRLAGVAHHLGIVDLRLYVHALAQATGQCVEVWASGAGSVARELGFADIGLVPDGIVVLSDDECSECYCVEVDCGTEPLGVLAKKLDLYQVMMGAGQSIDELWIVVTGASEGRALGIARLVMQSGLEQHTRIFMEEMIARRPVSHPPGRVGDGGHGRSRPNTHHNNSPNPKRSRQVECTYTDDDRGTVRTPAGRAVR